jgi:hypothetical protein
MTRAEYGDWSKRHALVFGFTEQQGAMVASWFEIFRGFGYTQTELRAATLTLASAPPEYPSQHLAGVQRVIGAARREADLRERISLAVPGPAEGEIGECVLCGNGGHVVVPHPRFVRNGRYYQSATNCLVICTCTFGRRAVEKYEQMPAEYRDTHGREMTLTEYQRIVPGWRAIRDEYEDALAADGREYQPPLEDRKATGMLADTMDRLALKYKVRLYRPKEVVGQ